MVRALPDDGKRYEVVDGELACDAPRRARATSAPSAGSTLVSGSTCRVVPWASA